MIEVYDYPTAMFDASPNPTDVWHPEVGFTNYSSTDVTGNTWSFGFDGALGGDITSEPSFTFPVSEPGIYPVQLLVSNQYGCLDSITIDVVVNDLYNFYVPNAFTPDNDGINDYFYPLGEGVSAANYKMYIFDRWGTQLFESDDMNTAWDGTFQGNKLKQEVYVWKIENENSITGERNEYIGHVVLVR